MNRSVSLCSHNTTRDQCASDSFCDWNGTACNRKIAQQDNKDDDVKFVRNRITASLSLFVVSAILAIVRFLFHDRIITNFKETHQKQYRYRFADFNFVLYACTVGVLGSAARVLYYDNKGSKKLRDLVTGSFVFTGLPLFILIIGFIAPFFAGWWGLIDVNGGANWFSDTLHSLYIEGTPFYAKSVHGVMLVLLFVGIGLLAASFTHIDSIQKQHNSPRERLSS